MTQSPTTTELTRVFGRIGVLSFGGPAAQIALMHRALVEEEGWLSERRFLNALSFCMLLPGPEAMQLATYAGWRIAGLWGGLIAGLLFVLPGALVILALAALYAAFGQLPLVEALFLGIKATVLIIVLQALLNLSRRALGPPLSWALAGLAFFAIFAADLPFPLVIALAALAGAIWMGKAPDEPPEPTTGRAHTLPVIVIGGLLWAAPLLLAWLIAPEGLLLELGLFFSKLAVVTFGGAYAVLTYMVQEVVGDLGWLNLDQMMDALGLAETTPGPLILVTEFVGFLAGYGAGGYGLALWAALLTLWVTFLPCFIWIFAFAPYVERITAEPRLNGALTGITAAVVGVILSLSLWFALNVFFAEVTRPNFGPLSIWWPTLSSLQIGAVVLASLAGLLLLRLKWGLFRALGVMALAGLAWQSAIMALFG